MNHFILYSAILLCSFQNTKICSSEAELKKTGWCRLTGRIRTQLQRKAKAFQASSHHHEKENFFDILSENLTTCLIIHELCTWTDPLTARVCPGVSYLKICFIFRDPKTLLCMRGKTNLLAQAAEASNHNNLHNVYMRVNVFHKSLNSVQHFLECLNNETGQVNFSVLLQPSDLRKWHLPSVLGRRLHVFLPYFCKTRKPNSHKSFDRFLQDFKLRLEFKTSWSLPTFIILRVSDTMKRLTVKTEVSRRDLTAEMFWYHIIVNMEIFCCNWMTKLSDCNRQLCLLNKHLKKMKTFGFLMQTVKDFLQFPELYLSG